MTAGSATWSGISSVSPDLYEASLRVLRESNMLVQTTRIFTDAIGMNPRKVTTTPAVSVSTQTEGQETASEAFNETLLSTLTPVSLMARVNLTDQRRASDDQNIQADIAFELGSAMAEYIDQTIAQQFAGLTGGTVGSAGGTLTWANILTARSKLKIAKVPGPYWCVLGHGHWNQLMVASTITASSFQNAPGFQDRLVQDYYVTSLLGGVTFVITANIPNSNGTAGTAAMYSSAAIAYDQRTKFTLEQQREAVARRNDMVGYMDVAIDQWAPARGVTLIGTDVV